MIRPRSGAADLTFLATALAAALAFPPTSSAAQQPYYPPPGDWERRDAATAGLDPDRLAAAVEFARANEAAAPRDLLEAHWRGFAREPFGEPVGAFATRGEPTGLVLRGGYVVAEWGEPARVDMTFSVTKSLVSTAVGLAWADGRIRDVHDPVGPYLAPIVLSPGDGEAGREAGAGFGAPRPTTLFGSERHRRITWDHLLRQTSDWAGTLWGKPDWSDRPGPEPAEWLTRERNEPGAAYAYNDTRVNLLALAATLVLREPPQAVVRDRVMRPIGASDSWQWHGYETSWITLDGTRVQVPSGGGHWGGGLFINAYDQARFGLLTLRRFRWEDRQILPAEWLDLATTPTAANPGYGFMNFFLNTGRERLPSAPESAWVHLGAGANMIYCDPVHDIVIVARWIDTAAMDGLVERVLGAIADIDAAR